MRHARAIFVLGAITGVALSFVGCPLCPVAGFEASPTSGSAPLTVAFTDTSTPGLCGIKSWNWDFGDGGMSVAQNPMHVYAEPDTYTVTLQVRGSLSSDTVTGTVTVTGPSEVFKLRLGLGTVSPEYVHGSIAASPDPSGPCEDGIGGPWCGLYPALTVVALTPTPFTGYVFDHWEGDVIGSVVPGHVVMDGDKYVNAVFVAVDEDKGKG